MSNPVIHANHSLLLVTIPMKLSLVPVRGTYLALYEEGQEEASDLDGQTADYDMRSSCDLICNIPPVHLPIPIYYSLLTIKREDQTPTLTAKSAHQTTPNHNSRKSTTYTPQAKPAPFLSAAHGYNNSPNTGKRAPACREENSPHRQRDRGLFLHEAVGFSERVAECQVRMWRRVEVLRRKM